MMNANFIVIAAAEAHTAAEGANPISELAGEFGVEWEFLIAQIINFCIVAFLLYRFAFKPILATIDQRQEKIADGLQYAEEMKVKLAEAEKKEAETLKKAQEEAQRIISETRESSKAFLEKQTQEAVAKAEEILSKADQAIEQGKQQMLAEVRSEIAALVVQTTAKVLSRDLSEAERASYVDSAAAELSTIES